MAISSITSNLLQFRLFKTDDASKSKDATEAQATGLATPSPQDAVEISGAALQRLESAKIIGNDPEKAKAVAGETREILEDEFVSLGLDSTVVS